MSASITGLGHSFPHAVSQDDLWAEYFAGHYDNSPIARRLFKSSGVVTRHSVANPIIDDVSDWSTAERMERYVPEALPLVTKACIDAMRAANVDAGDIGMFAVVSCTGYATPGIDTMAADRLGLKSGTSRLVIGHMGCYAALPGLRSVADYVSANNRPALLVCVELASLHVQSATNDVEQMVAHALFSDAAAAAVLEPASTNAEPGFEIVDVELVTDTADADLMTWKITDKGFRMGLSQKVPDVLSQHVRPLIDRLLQRNRLDIDDIAAWAAHPGGPRILDVIQEHLELKPDALNESRATLAEHGNCSSATVLVVLDAIARGREIPSGRHVVALAFGPGLTLYSVLLKRT